MSGKTSINIDVNINITDESAVLCAGLLDMFCQKQRGDFDIGYKGCKGCALVRDGYCNYRHIQAWYKVEG